MKKSEIEKRFPQKNDSMTSYHIRSAAVDLCVAWAHMTIEEIEETKINEIINKLSEMAEKFEKEGN